MAAVNIGQPMNSNSINRNCITDEEGDDDVPLVARLKNIQQNVDRKHDLEEDDDDDDLPLITKLNQQKKQSVDATKVIKKEKIKKEQISQSGNTKTTAKKEKEPKKQNTNLVTSKATNLENSQEAKPKKSLKMPLKIVTIADTAESQLSLQDQKKNKRKKLNQRTKPKQNVKMRNIAGGKIPHFWKKAV